MEWSTDSNWFALCMVMLIIFIGIIVATCLGEYFSDQKAKKLEADPNNRNVVTGESWLKKSSKEKIEIPRDAVVHYEKFMNKELPAVIRAAILKIQAGHPVNHPISMDHEWLIYPELRDEFLELIQRSPHMAKIEVPTGTLDLGSTLVLRLFVREKHVWTEDHSIDPEKLGDASWKDLEERAKLSGRSIDDVLASDRLSVDNVPELKPVPHSDAP